MKMRTLTWWAEGIIEMAVLLLVLSTIEVLLANAAPVQAVVWAKVSGVVVGFWTHRTLGKGMRKRP